MSRHIVTFEDVAFTSTLDTDKYDPEGGLELTEEELRGFSEVRVQEEEFPAGILAVRKVTAFPDDSVYEAGKDESGDIKFFVSIELLVETEVEDDIWSMDAPSALFAELTDMLPGNLSLERNWEVTEHEAEESAPNPSA